jgi:tetratricopeptide (TPR) repeat protein
MLNRIRAAAFLAAVVMCVSSCSSASLPPPPDLSKAPGFDQYCSARDAYRDYLDLIYLEEGSQRELGEDIEHRKRRHLAVADENARAALELNPDFALARMLLGAVCVETGKYIEALAEFEEVLRIDPLADNAWVNIARVYQLQGKTQEALSAIDKALEVNPKSIHAARLHELIEKEGSPGRKSEPHFRPRLGK